MFCREQVAQLRGELARIRARGAELVVVGQGRPEEAARFRDEGGIDFPLLVDPERRAYAAAGLRRGLRAVLQPRLLVHMLRAWRGGFRQSRSQGDAWQLGGTFVVCPDGSVPFAHASRAPGDHPPVRAILAALVPPAAGR